MNRYQDPVVAVVGATGAVGEVMLSILAERLGPDLEVRALASERSLGARVEFGERMLDVEVLESFDFAGVDFALFSAGASVSREHAPRAAGAGSRLACTRRRSTRRPAPGARPTAGTSSAGVSPAQG